MEKIGKIQKILGEQLSAADWKIKRYSCREDFESLWEIGESEIEGEKIIVIWDGFPDNSSDNSLVDLRQFITPIDWALAYSLKHEDKDLKIVILDGYSHKFGYKDDRVRGFHINSLNTMQGWVKFYSFNQKVFGNRDIIKSPLTIMEDINKNGFFSKQNTDIEVRENTTKNTWGQMLIAIAENDRTRHTINNILDPIQLAELTLSKKDFGEIYNQRPIYTKAFYNSLKWHNVIVEKTEENQNDDKDLDLGDAKVILIDDHAKSGWEALLNKWIYPNNNKKICSKTNASFIIDKLEMLEKESIQSNRFNLNFKDNSDEILLFDLYLYPSDPPDDEIKYFKAVIDLAYKFMEDSEDISQDILELKDNLSDSEYKEENRMNYLTLLPRLIAEIDPSIPIIIFSSTEQDRDLIAVVSPYNSIVIFSKPPVFSSQNKTTDPHKLKQKKHDFRRRLHV